MPWWWRAVFRVQGPSLKIEQSQKIVLNSYKIHKEEGKIRIIFAVVIMSEKLCSGSISKYRKSKIKTEKIAGEWGRKNETRWQYFLVIFQQIPIFGSVFWTLNITSSIVQRWEMWWYHVTSLLPYTHMGQNAWLFSKSVQFFLYFVFFSRGNDLCDIIYIYL